MNRGAPAAVGEQGTPFISHVPAGLKPDATI